MTIHRSALHQTVPAVHSGRQRGAAGESYSGDVLKSARPKCSRAAGLSVPLCSPCKQHRPGNVKRKHMTLVSVQTISIVVFADGPFPHENAFLFELHKKCGQGSRMLRNGAVSGVSSPGEFKDHILCSPLSFGRNEK